VGVRKQPSSGIFQLAIDDHKQGEPGDTFSPLAECAEFDLGDRAFTAPGAAQFKFTVSGKNPLGCGYGLVIDYIKLTPDPLDVYFESELSKVVNSSGSTVQAFADPHCRGGQGDKLNADRAGEFLTYAVDVPEARTYQVMIGVKKQNTRGFLKLSIDRAQQSSPQDCFTETDTYQELDFGAKHFAVNGEHQFRFAVSDRNPKSLGFTLGLDYIRLIPRSPDANESTGR
jgi:hypothetical protein